MEATIASLCQQANAANLSLLLSLHFPDDLGNLDSRLSMIEGQLTAIRAQLQLEQQMLQEAKTMALNAMNSKPQSKLKVSFEPSSPASSPQTTVISQVAVEDGYIAEVQEDEFAILPKYMKGRLTMQKINQSVDQLNAIFKDKYSIMTCANPTKLSNENRQRFYAWREVECDEVAGRQFITEQDVKSFATIKKDAFKLDPMGRSILAILRHLGGFFSSLYYTLWGNREYRIIIIGLDGAGKTTILNRLLLNESPATIPTIGFNVESVKVKNVKFQMWDLGGQTSIRPYWRCYYANTDGIVFVVDSADLDRVANAKTELGAMLQEDDLKRDLPGALNEAQMSEAMGLVEIKDRPWHIQTATAIRGEGIDLGFEWMVGARSEEFRSPRQAAIQGRDAIHRQYELDDLISRQFEAGEREEEDGAADGEEVFLASEAGQVHYHHRFRLKDGNMSDIVAETAFPTETNIISGSSRNSRKRPRKRKSLRLRRSHRRVLRDLLDEPKRKKKRRRVYSSESSDSSESSSDSGHEIEHERGGGRYNLRTLSTRLPKRFFDPYQARLSEPTARRQAEPRVRRPSSLPHGMVSWATVDEQHQQPPTQPEGEDASEQRKGEEIKLPTKLTLDMIAGVEEHVSRLKEMIIFPLRYPDLFGRLGITPPRGVLFHGPPGTGKTLLARILASTASTPDRPVSFFMRNGAECLSKWIGEAEQNLVKLFRTAQQSAPSIIFFDEIDGMAPDRSARVDHSHVSLVSTLLALMDGLESRGQVVIIGATNRLEAIDPALRRPGRFDREFYFGLPDCSARKKILQLNSKTWPSAPDENQLHSLAARCDGYSGADLRSLCTEASLNAFRRIYPEAYLDQELPETREFAILEEDFERALKSVPASNVRQQTIKLDPLLQCLMSASIQQVKYSLSIGRFDCPFLVFDSPFESCPRQTELMMAFATELVGLAHVHRLDLLLAQRDPLASLEVLLGRWFDSNTSRKIFVIPRWSSLVERLTATELTILLNVMMERLSLPGNVAVLCNEMVPELEEEVGMQPIRLPYPDQCAWNRFVEAAKPITEPNSRVMKRLACYRGKLSKLIRAAYLARHQPFALEQIVS